MQRDRVAGCVRVREESARGVLGHVGVCWPSPLSFLSLIKSLLQGVFLALALELYVCLVLVSLEWVCLDSFHQKAVGEAQTPGVCFPFTALG